ncbi:MAG: FAD-dependent oxidoreductase [Verrucomicrobia bacterium]|nr:FAD-dependent oxidoreductase [Verrucomicrobiota bacterium]
MNATRSLLIVGAGEFGLTAALELRRRGWAVTLVDAGTIPRDTAASTDISKVVRCDYGADEQHIALGEAALAGWHVWNRQWGAPLYHEDGFLVLAREAMKPGGFEHESLAKLTARGHRLERLDSSALRKNFPAWAAEKYPDGYFNPRGGWAESGKVIARLVAQAKAEGVIVRESVACVRMIESGSRVTGIVTPAGEELRAELVLVAAGAWTPTLLPELQPMMWATGQPVLHFQVDDPRAWQAPRFPVWAADIARTGWYGFPALADGTLKLANHGPGRRVPPDAPRDVLPEEIEKFRAFLRDSLPALADAPLRHTRLCLYCDTFDGAFWMDHHPQRPGLVVAAGDSGHAFKFAPVLGALIADVVEKKPNAFAARYAWREPKAKVAESARAK